MTVHEEFERRVVGEMTAIIRKIDRNELQGKLAKAWEGNGFDLPGLSEEEWFYREVAWYFWEVGASFDVLKHIPVYLRFFPKYKTWSTHGITPRRHLRYHVERYLEETYILQLRVKGFLDWLAGRLKAGGLQENSNRAASIKKKFVGFMRQHAKTRGMHVHRKRYSDEGFWWMEAAELAGGGDPDLADFADGLCETYRWSWREKIQRDNEALRRELDGVFSQVGPLVFPDWGNASQVEA